MTHGHNREVLVSAIAALHQDKNTALLFQRYLSQYYADLPIEDLAQRDPSDLYGAAQAHWRLTEKRRAGECLIHIYNPIFSEHGWQSNHTVLELVHDNIPFLVDTVNITLSQLGYNWHLLIHPVFLISRDEAGRITRIGDRQGQAESWIHIEFDRETDPVRLENIEQELFNALEHLMASVQDFPKMANAVKAEIQTLKKHPPQLELAQIQEGIAFLNWLLDANFVFLGCRDYVLTDKKDEEVLAIVPNSGLGLLREHGNITTSRAFAALPDELRRLAHDKTLLLLTKSNSRARVHRAAYMDLVITKHFDEQGNVIGERRFVGLYTACAHNTPNRQIPILRSKIQAVLARMKADLSGHKGKKLLTTLDMFPRDELIEITVPELERIATGIVSLQDRKQVRVFIREDVYRRYISVMLFMPKDNYNTDVRLKIQQILLDAFKGSSAEFTVQLTDDMLARVHFIVRLEHPRRLSYNPQEIETQVAQAARRWQDELYNQLRQHAGEERGVRLYGYYQNAFPASYCADFNARLAVYDIEKLEKSLATSQLQLLITPASIADPCHYRLRLYYPTPIELSDSLPILDNMGVRIAEERPYTLHFPDNRLGWISEVGIRIPAERTLDNDLLRQNFQEGVIATFSGYAENDSFNRLILFAGLTWRETMLVRAYVRYIKQLGINYGQGIASDHLAKHAAVVQMMVHFILARHTPNADNSIQTAELEKDISQAIAQIYNLDEERILSGLWAAIKATVRINYFQTEQEQPKEYISFKISSHNIPYMPQPVPLYEIFVYSPRVEGIHLRGGKVARGGVRWSDRREDFRTEVLGLVKAQMVKNTVIVPVGSKGGFVCKQLPPSLDRALLQAEGIACYRTFISGLLDLTDNIAESGVIPPPAVVRLDEDDPYLVVAADKGTASFSDIANTVSEQYHFWLSDAFASGGSVGYDHKKMAITARGAWESAKRQFRELGKDIQNEDFTVVGIGDMAGDVFGNGMLRSRHIQLVGAFNHQHIFLDPTPDPVVSFRERERLFALPQSSWEDYNKSLISEGGGIFSRQARSIALSREIQALLDIEDAQLTPDELIHAMLKAPVEMIYNGGIGTYVKASTQSHAEANDKANDSLRVNGDEIRAKVIVEGGNLGLTQLGRIEYALQHGQVYTDAIDNSAGVDCSDYEVNIKILLGVLIQNGDMTFKQRNLLLASMAEEVALLVLKDNYQQTQTISLEYSQALSLTPVYKRFMRYLEKTGRLSRRIEYLPDEKQLIDRALLHIGLTKPEIAVLLAYSKMDLYENMLNSTLPDDPMWNTLLTAYFPDILTKKFAAYLPQHSLRREIIATELTNRIVNQMGSTFVFRIQEEAETGIANIVRAWYQACEMLGSKKYFAQIEALDDKVDTCTQYMMLLEVRRQLERLTRWLLHFAQTGQDTSALSAILQQYLPTQLATMPRLLKNSERHQNSMKELLTAGVPEKLAKSIVYLDGVIPLLHAVRIANQQQYPVEEITKLHFYLSNIVRLDWLTKLIDDLPRNNRWQALARQACRYDLYQAHSMLVERVFENNRNKSVDAIFKDWVHNNASNLEHCMSLFEELEQSTPDLAMVSAAIREIATRL